MDQKPVSSLVLPFPSKGVSRRLSYQETPGDTTPDANNVRPDASIESRERGGSRPALVKWDSAQPGGSNAVRLIGEAFYSTGTAYAKHLVMSANGGLYRYNSAGSWTTITGGTALVSSRPLSGCDLLNNYYIANDTGGGIQVWDPTGTTKSDLTATEGTVPSDCHIVARYRDRLLLAGDQANPHVIHASRQGDPTDWDFTAQGKQASWKGSTADAGQIGMPVTALIPHGDDCCIVGCSSELWVIRSDPAHGGSVDNLSRAIGVFDYTSWCHDSEGNLWFISYNDGLYFMSGGCGNIPLSVSREKIPEEFLNLTRGTDVVTMTYDVRDRGLHVVINGSSDSAWFVDLKIQRGGDNTANRNWASFWPQSYQADHYPMFQFHRRESSHSDSQALWGGSDGYLRHHDYTLSQDDGSNEIVSEVCYLFPLAPNGHVGILNSIEVVPAAGSGDIDAAISIGNSMEEAFDATALTTLEFNTAGYSCAQYPRLRGNAAKVKLSNGEANAKWAMEELYVEIAEGGRRR